MTGVAAAGLVLIATGVASAQPQRGKPAEPSVAAANQSVATQLLFGDRQDFEDAERGFIATIPFPLMPGLYDFLEGEAPPTVNPSLWRQARLNVPNGLFVATTTVTTTRSVLERIVLGRRTLADAVEQHDLTTTGNAQAVVDLWALLVNFQTGFPLVEPPK